MDIETKEILIRLVILFLGLFGSIITGIISYFLASLIKGLRDSDKELKQSYTDLLAGFNKLTIKIVKVEKDIEHIFSNFDIDE